MSGKVGNLMAKSYHSIPTKIGGIQYRSRLEATWAAFFCYVGWDAIYEPMDLSGWIPDFMIVTATKQILVEVKPVLECDDFPLEKSGEL